MPRGEGKRRSSTWDRRLQKADDQKTRKRTRIEELFSLRHIPPTRQCPITSGWPTQMTAKEKARTGETVRAYGESSRRGGNL